MLIEIGIDEERDVGWGYKYSIDWYQFHTMIFVELLLLSQQII